jgi:gentisate 1,2-dioxygenase
MNLNDLNPKEIAEGVRIYEYTSASNPLLKKVPILFHESNLYQEGETRIIPFDNSRLLDTDYPATSPSLLCSFIKINERDGIYTEATATSQLFYVIKGHGFSTIYGKEGNRQTFHWSTGDLFVVPFLKDGEMTMKHSAIEDSALFWVTDEPLLKYLGVIPNEPKFNLTFFSKEKMFTALTDIREENEALDLNRLGILLGNEATEHSTKTITHTLWSLLNVLPANLVQKPHRHNSVAIDFCILADNQSGGIYTLIGEELDDKGWIKNPKKCYWETGSVFITPPGLWHSHHNETGEDAYVLPIQDAGLHTYLRTLDIRFS